jgi:XTP/dITP diphosphohydrolase
LKLVVATNNRNKFFEINEKMAGIGGLELIPLSAFATAPEVREDRDTFEGNAGKKALEISAHTGLPALADDSGLAVDALGGRPGVFSARYGGPGKTDRERCLLLLDELNGIEDAKRSARFVCVIAIAFPDGEIHMARGECEGIIAHEPKGEMGFGYDPVFYLPGMHKTMAEIPMGEKNKISHRARALDGAREILKSIMERQDAEGPIR